MRPLLISLVALAGVTATAVGAEPPTVLRAVPVGLAAGKPVDVSFVGRDVVGVDSLWSSSPLAFELLPHTGSGEAPQDRVAFRLTAPADAPVGPLAVRLVGPQGVSNVRLLFVDDLRTVAEQGSHAQADAAQVVPFPCAVEGACDAEASDFFRVSLPGGQRVTVDVWARRLGSLADPVVRILDISGRELAYSDDDDTAGADSRLSFVAPESGEYLLEIRDIRYAGNGDYRYRIRLGNMPLVAAPFPLAAVRGSSPHLELVELTGAPLAPLEMVAPASATAQHSRVVARLEGGAGSLPLVLQRTIGPEQVEWEPNDTPETAAAWTLAGAINGRFDAPRDRDWFEFTAAKGSKWRLACQSRQLGSPADLFVRVYKADGARLAELAEAGADDGVLEVTFAEDGTYRLMVEELHRRGGPEFVYRIAVEPAEAGFTLAAGVDRATAPHAGVVSIPITCVRRGYDGPITLAVSGAAGLKLRGNVIAEKKNDATLLITVPDALPTGSLHHLQITGSAKLGEQTLSAAADTRAALSASLAGYPYPPAELAGTVALGIGGVYPDFFELSLAEKVILWPQNQTSTKATVELKRLSGFKDSVAVEIVGLPEGVTAKVEPIAADKTSTSIELTGPATLAPGDYPVRIVGIGVFNLQTKQVYVSDVALRVVAPVEVSLDAPASVAPGSTAKINVRVTRHGGEARSVTITWPDLPPGVNVSGPESIAADQSAAEYQLHAGNVPAGAPFAVRAVATTAVAGRAVRVASMPRAMVVESVQIAQP